MNYENELAVLALILIGPHYCIKNPNGKDQGCQQSNTGRFLICDPFNPEKNRITPLRECAQEPRPRGEDEGGVDGTDFFQGGEGEMPARGVV